MVLGSFFVSDLVTALLRSILDSSLVVTFGSTLVVTFGSTLVVVFGSILVSDLVIAFFGFANASGLVVRSTMVSDFVTTLLESFLVSLI